MHFLSSHVGIGSNSQDLLGLFMMIVQTLSVVAGQSTHSGVMFCCCGFISNSGTVVFANLLYFALKKSKNWKGRLYLHFYLDFMTNLQINLFIHNTELNEENQLMHLVNAIRPDGEYEAILLEHSTYFNDFSCIICK